MATHPAFRLWGKAGRPPRRHRRAPLVGLIPTKSAYRSHSWTTSIRKQHGLPPTPDEESARARFGLARMRRRRWTTSEDVVGRPGRTTALRARHGGASAASRRPLACRREIRAPQIQARHNETAPERAALEGMVEVVRPCRGAADPRSLDPASVLEGGHALQHETTRPTVSPRFRRCRSCRTCRRRPGTAAAAPAAGSASSR